MKYVLLVSHGTIAPALHETMRLFFVGSRSDLLHANVDAGMGPDDYVKQLQETLQVVEPEDEIIVLADLLGGSPLTYASYVINMMGMLEKTVFLAGMNLPTAIDVMLKKDTTDIHNLEKEILNNRKDGLMPFTLPALQEEQYECI